MTLALITIIVLAGGSGLTTGYFLGRRTGYKQATRQYKKEDTLRELSTSDLVDELASREPERLLE